MKILIINSAKGGVGKTFVSTGIAKALADQGYRVAVFDLDFTTPNVEQIEGVELYVSGERSEKSKTQIKRLLSKNITKAKKNGMDYVVIDTPPTISSTYIALTETIKNPKILYVSTPSPNAIKDTERGIKFFASRGFSPIGLVQNMTNGVFGDAIEDVEERMGVKPFGNIPLTTDTNEIAEAFREIATKVESVEFDAGGIKENLGATPLSRLTAEDIERDPDIPLRFYNLETWDTMRGKLVEKDLVTASLYGGMTPVSRFEIPTDKLRAIIEQGEAATVMVSGNHLIDKAPLPFEIAEMTIDYSHKYMKGLPVLVSPSGATLFLDEVIVAEEWMVKDYLDNGGLDLGNGRVVPHLFQMLAMHRMTAIPTRAFSYAIEYKLIEKYLTETSTWGNYRLPDIAKAVCALEENKESIGDMSDKDLVDYIESSKEEYPDLHRHLLNIFDMEKKTIYLSCNEAALLGESSKRAKEIIEEHWHDFASKRSSTIEIAFLSPEKLKEKAEVSGGNKKELYVYIASDEEKIAENLKKANVVDNPLDLIQATESICNLDTEIRIFSEQCDQLVLFEGIPSSESVQCVINDKMPHPYQVFVEKTQSLDHSTKVEVGIATDNHTIDI